MRRLDGSRISAAVIDATVTRAMTAASVTGLALAIIDRGQIVHLRGYGHRDVARGLPMTADTVVAGASFTKSAFALLVLQLVDERQLDLDRPVVAYLDRPLTDLDAYRDLAGDPRVGRITARMLLAHTSGLPNWRWLNDDEKLDLVGEPGERYAYSGEGIALLQRVVEHITGQSLGELMAKRVFAGAGMSRTSMTWQPQHEADAAVGYGVDGRAHGHAHRDKPDAAGSMDTTVHDWARLIATLQRGHGLGPTARAEMWRPQIRIRSRRQFPTRDRETTNAHDAIELSYGLGWGLFTTPHGRACFKEGHDDGWQHHSVSFIDAGLAIVIMTNSDRGDRTFTELLATLLGDTYTPWQWEGYAGPQ